MENLTEKIQSSQVKLLDKLDGSDDPKQIREIAEAYEKVSSAEAKQQEAWSTYQKVNNEHEEKMKEIQNAQNKDLIDGGLKALGIVGSTVLGTSLMKRFLEFEQTGTWPSSWLSKEFFLGIARKVFFRK